jgi:hypothetical protein
MAVICLGLEDLLPAQLVSWLSAGGLSRGQHHPGSWSSPWGCLASSQHGGIPEYNSTNHFYPILPSREGARQACVTEEVGCPPWEEQEELVAVLIDHTHGTFNFIYFISSWCWGLNPGLRAS